MKKIFAAIALLAIVLGTTQSTYACSVVAGYPGTPAQTIAAKDIAFIGTVQSVAQAQTEYSEYAITFKNEQTYKGTVPATITVTSQSSSAACGYDDGKGTFTTGSVWMIYATGNATDRYKTNAISLNTKYDSVAAATAALASAGVTPGSADFSVALKVGAKGDSVKNLQTLLTARGYSVGTIDGIFGLKTKNAVMKYQSTSQLSVDGIAGVKTMSTLSAFVVPVAVQ